MNISQMIGGRTGGVGAVAAAVLLGLAGPACANDSTGAAPVTLVWDANTETDLAGYRVHYGLSSGAPTTTVEAGSKTTVTLDGLAAGKTYYVVVTAYNTSGLESLPSEEIAFSALSLPPTLALEPLTAPVAGDPALTARAPTIGDWAPQPTGAFEFTITATPGQPLAIYASHDMLNWELLGTTTNPTGRVRATDHAAASAVGRYYQVLPQAQ